MEGAASKLALFWLNSLIEVPSALLINSLDELSDGKVLIDVTNALQEKYLSLHGGVPYTTISGLNSIIQWLTETFGHASLPTEVSSAGAADRIRSAHILTITALVNFLKHRMDEMDMLSMVSSPMRPREASSLLGRGFGRTFASEVPVSRSTVGIQRYNAPHTATYGSKSMQSTDIRMYNNRDDDRDDAAVTAGRRERHDAEYLRVYDDLPAEYSATQQRQQQHYRQLKQQQPAEDSKNIHSYHDSSTPTRYGGSSMYGLASPSGGSEFDGLSSPGMNVTIMDTKPSNRVGDVRNNLLKMLGKVEERHVPRAEDPVASVPSKPVGAGRITATNGSTTATNNANKPSKHAPAVKPRAMYQPPPVPATAIRASSGARPGWNESTALPSPKRAPVGLRSPPQLKLVKEHAIQHAAVGGGTGGSAVHGASNGGMQRAPGAFVHGGLYDPTYQPKHVVKTDLAPRITATRQRMAATHEHAKYENIAQHHDVPPVPEPVPEPIPPKASEYVEPPHLHAARALVRAVEPVVTNKWRTLYAWLSHLKVLSLMHLDASSNTFPDQVSEALSDGIPLSELAVAVETKAGNRIASMSARYKGQHVQLLPGSVVPKSSNVNAAAASKNLELALAVFRNNPKVNSRYLWSDDEIRCMASEKVAVGLLEDIFRAYSHGFHDRPNFSTTRTDRGPKALLAPDDFAATVPDQATVEHIVTSTLADSRSVRPELALAQRFVINAPLRDEEQEPTSARSNDSASKRTVSIAVESKVETAPTMQQKTVVKIPVSKIVPKSKQLSILPEPVPVPQEVLHMLPAAAFALQSRGLLQSGRLSKIAAPPTSEYDEGRVRAWLHDLGVAGLLPANPKLKQHVLENALLNGTLLVEVMKRLEPDAYPLGGEGGLRHYAKPRSLAEARANIEAALSILRTSPAATGNSMVQLQDLYSMVASGGRRSISPHLLWCCEELLVGNADIGWALLDEVCQQYQWIHRMAVFNRNGAPLVQSKAAQATDIVPEQAALVTLSPARLGSPRMHGTTLHSPTLSAYARHSDPRSDIIAWLQSIDLIPDDMDENTAWSSGGIVPLVCSGILLSKIYEHISGASIRGLTFPATTPIIAEQNVSKCLLSLGTLKGMSTRMLKDRSTLGKLMLGDTDTVANLLSDCMQCYRGEVPMLASPGFTKSRLMMPPAPAEVYHPADVFQPRAPLPISPASTNRSVNSPQAFKGETESAVHPQALLALPSPPRAREATTRTMHAPSNLPAREAGVAPDETRRTDAHGGAPIGGKVAAEVSTITTWLAGLGIELPHPSLLAGKVGSDPCMDFQDGTLLVRIVEACENLRGGHRGGIAGIDKFPKTGAARLANIRRALELLRENRTMPLDYLWSELAIRDGSPPVIRGLLLHIRKAYGFISD